MNIRSSNVSSSNELDNIIDNPMNHPKINWNHENETIIIEWCDVARCYKWLNARAHMSYTNYNALFTIPTIILSTISGTASFAINSLPPVAQTYAPIAIGSVNIFVGILTTVQQYLKISELNEAYRVSSIAWDKYARSIRLELAKSPKERTDAEQFLKICRQEYDRLMETTPTIPSYVINEFNRKFSGKPGSTTRKKFEELYKPDILNTITSASEYNYSWHNDLNIHKSAMMNHENEYHNGRKKHGGGKGGGSHAGSRSVSRNGSRRNIHKTIQNEVDMHNKLHMAKENKKKDKPPPPPPTKGGEPKDYFIDEVYV